MLRKSIISLIAMLLLMALVAGCAPVQEGGAGGGDSAASEGDSGSDGAIKIGVLTPLSPPGDVAAGQLVQRAAELAVQYVNEEMGGVLDGRMIEIVMEDDQGTPEVGVAGYRRLVSQEGVVGVIGQYHSSVNLAVNEVAKEMGVPVMATQASNKNITALGYDIAFRTHAVDPVRANAWMSFINDNGFTKIALVSEDTDYGIGLVDEMEDRVDGTDIELLPIVFTRIWSSTSVWVKAHI